MQQDRLPPMIVLYSVERDGFPEHRFAGGREALLVHLWALRSRHPDAHWSAAPVTPGLAQASSVLAQAS